MQAISPVEVASPAKASAAKKAAAKPPVAKETSPSAKAPAVSAPAIPPTSDTAKVSRRRPPKAWEFSWDSTAEDADTETMRAVETTPVAEESTPAAQVAPLSEPEPATAAIATTPERATSRKKAPRARVTRAVQGVLPLDDSDTTAPARSGPPVPAAPQADAAPASPIEPAVDEITPSTGDAVHGAELLTAEPETVHADAAETGAVQAALPAPSGDDALVSADAAPVVPVEETAPAPVEPTQGAKPASTIPTATADLPAEDQAESDGQPVGFQRTRIQRSTLMVPPRRRDGRAREVQVERVVRSEGRGSLRDPSQPRPKLTMASLLARQESKEAQDPVAVEGAVFLAAPSTPAAHQATIAAVPTAQAETVSAALVDTAEILRQHEDSRLVKTAAELEDLVNDMRSQPGLGAKAKELLHEMRRALARCEIDILKNV